MVAAVGVYAAVVAVAAHLRRAKYVTRARATVVRVRERVTRRWKIITGPFVRAFQRVRHGFTLSH